MRRTIYLLCLLTLLLMMSVSSISIAQADDTSDAIPVIYDAPQFEVEVTTHTYGYGLSHTSWNSDDADPVELLLDLYEPVNAPDNRPAMVIIHGGGYVGGSRQQGALVQIAEYYASRGWVVMAIDYRLAGARGTLPSEVYDSISATVPRGQRDVALAIYPANRDAKAAVRWLYANAETYQINTDYITALGGSAGAGVAITLGITDDEHFRDEISVEDDFTLMSTNLLESSQVHTVINFWGADWGIEMLTNAYGGTYYDDTDVPILIVHGTSDMTVDFSNAEDLQERYDETGVPYELYPLENRGHGAWDATVDGASLFDLAFDFIIEQQALVIGD